MAEPKKVYVNHEKLEDLITVDNCTATVALTIVNGDVYYVRTKDNDAVKETVILHKLEGYLSGGSKKHSAVAIKTSSGTTAIAKHANSLTYHNGVFYLATRNGKKKTDYQVMAFGEDGIIKNKYSYSGGEEIETIDYFDTKNNTPRFLVSLGHSTEHDGKVKFKVVKMSNSTNEIVDSKDKITFYARCPYDSFDAGNDCYYNCSTKKLYVTRIATAEKPLKKSVVLEYDLTELSGKTYDADLAFIDERNTNTEYKYEIEGIAMYNNYTYICANATAKDTVGRKHPQADVFCKLAEK